MKRSLFVIALGITFLILMTWAGTILTSIIPRHPTAQVQTAQAGNYQVTLQVDPNPPLITQPATLSIQVVSTVSHQFITNARITLETSMETMDMGTDQADAKPQSNGTYRLKVLFSMSGPWQVRVLVTLPGAETQSTAFEVTVQ